MNAPRTLLKVDASGRRDGSLSRALGARLADGLLDAGAVDRVIGRDLLDGVEHVDPDWIGANFTPADDRSEAQRARLAGSDALVDELLAAEAIVIGCPIYNFGPPAALKAWVDQIARARRTFVYTENGPKGLLEGKRAYLIVTSGGTAVDSPIDFATPYLRHALGFVGIDDVTVIAADRTMARGEAAADEARARVDELVEAARDGAANAPADGSAPVPGDAADGAADGPGDGATLAAAGSPRGPTDPALADRAAS